MWPKYQIEMYLDNRYSSEENWQNISNCKINAFSASLQPSLAQQHSPVSDVWRCAALCFMRGSSSPTEYRQQSYKSTFSQTFLSARRFESYDWYNFMSFDAISNAGYLEHASRKHKCLVACTPGLCNLVIIWREATNSTVLLCVAMVHLRRFCIWDASIDF